MKQIEPQQYVLVPKDLLSRIDESQKKILELFNKVNQTEDALGEFISEMAAKKLLGRKTTWFWQMRTSGKLEFAKVGSKVFYSRTQLLKLFKEK